MKISYDDSDEHTPNLVKEFPFSSEAIRTISLIKKLYYNK